MSPEFYLDIAHLFHGTIHLGKKTLEFNHI